MNRQACVVVLISLAATAAALAQQQHSQSGTPKPAHLMEGYGRHHHPIATTSPEAQKFFNQGLELAYGFNYAEAVRSFQRAAELDPKAAMPYWGIGWALGPYYNKPAIPFAEEQKALEAVKQAQTRDANSPQPERDHIAALAQRYSSDPKVNRHQLGEAFHHAMPSHISARTGDWEASAMSNVRAAGCETEPYKTKPTWAGCTDVYRACACDDDGDNCHWVWICVR